MFDDQPPGMRIKNWSLSKRKIGDIGAEALLEFQLPRIEQLSLDGNEISDIGVAKLSSHAS